MSSYFPQGETEGSHHMCHNGDTGSVVTSRTLVLKEISLISNIRSMSFFKRTVFALLLVAVMLSFGFIGAGQANAQTSSNVDLIASLNEQIAALLSQIKTLQGQVDDLQNQDDSTGIEIVPVDCQIAQKPLFRNHPDTEAVKRLQRFLQSRPEAVWPQTVGATGFYGPLTEASVRAFQRAHGIATSGSAETTGYGTVNELTLNKINSLACGEPITDVVSLVKVEVTTDKQVYKVGEVVDATVTAYNKSDFPVTLKWNSGCQYRFYLDGRSMTGNVCTAALTSQTIEAGGSFSWGYDFAGPTTAGSHKVTGEVIGYGSESIAITAVSSVNGNLPPVVEGLSAPTLLSVGERGTWSVKASDPENGRLSYRVDWGERRVALPTGTAAIDEAISQTSTFSHSYSQPGTYTQTFTITDDKGARAVTSSTVKVGHDDGEYRLIVTEPPFGATWTIGESAGVKWQVLSPRQGLLPDTAALIVYLTEGPSPSRIVTVTGVQEGFGGDTFTVPKTAIQGDIATQMMPGKYKIRMTLYDKMPCLGFCPQNDAKLLAQDISSTVVTVVSDSVDVARGDCNASGRVDRSDIDSISREIFDGDGTRAKDAAGGSYPGNPYGCDANADEQINAADISCTVLLINGQRCDGSVTPKLISVSPEKAQVNTRVTLRGSHLKGEGYVLMNGMVASELSGDISSNFTNSEFVTFSVPKYLRPVPPEGGWGCHPVGGGQTVCVDPGPDVAVTPGQYKVSIKVNGVESNGLALQVTDKSAGFKVVEPQEGDLWKIGEVKTVKWQRLNSSASRVDIRLDHYQTCDTNVSQICPAIALPSYELTNNFFSSRGEYRWSVGSKLSSGLVPEGKYVIVVCDSATNECHRSGMFSVVAKTSSKVPIIDRLSPTSGLIGTEVRLTVRNHNLSQDKVYFDGYLMNHEVEELFSVQDSFFNQDSATYKFRIPEIVSNSICVDNRCTAGAALRVQPGYHSISVGNDYGRSKTKTFNVTLGQSNEPEIVEMSPASGPVGTAVKILVRNASSNDVLKFDGHQIGHSLPPFTSSTALSGGFIEPLKTYLFTVPRSLSHTINCVRAPCPVGQAILVQPGSHYLTISNNNGTSDEKRFEVTSSDVNQKIDVISPTSSTYKPSDFLTIRWNYEGINSGDLVEIGYRPVNSFVESRTTAITKVSAGTKSYVWRIPSSLASGAYQIEVIHNQSPKPAVVGYSEAFKVSSPVTIVPIIKNVSPLSASVGEAVIIDGSGFGTNVRVFLDGNEIYSGRTINDTRVDFEMPTTMQPPMPVCPGGFDCVTVMPPRIKVLPGRYTLTVESNGKVSNQKDFTVTASTAQAPRIASLTPSAGAPGDHFFLSLASAENLGSIYVGDTQAEIIDRGAEVGDFTGTYKVEVPDMAPGLYYVTARSTSGAASNSRVFIVYQVAYSSTNAQVRGAYSVNPTYYNNYPGFYQPTQNYNADLPASYFGDFNPYIGY